MRVSAYVYIYPCAYMYEYIHAHIHTHTHTHTHMYIYNTVSGGKQLCGNSPAQLLELGVLECAQSIFSFFVLLLQHPPQQLCGSAPKTAVSIGGPGVLLFTEHCFLFFLLLQHSPQQLCGGTSKAAV